jgi:hypothetical protein
MSPSVAAIIFVIGIAGLFFLDRDKKTRVSTALWIPTAWLFFCSSRSVGEWLGMTSTGANQPTAGAYIEGNPVDRAFFTALEIVALIVVISRGRRVSRILSQNWIIVAFFFYAALSISWSDFPFVTLKHWTKGIGDLMMVLIVLTEPSVPHAIKRLATRIGFVLLPLSVLFIRYYPLLGRRLNNSWIMEPVGVCSQKNGLGALCDIFGLVLLWRFRSAYNDRKDPNRRRRLIAFGAVLAMTVWLFSVSMSMTSICAFSMASAAMMFSTRAECRRKPALVHVLIAGMLVISVYALFFQSSGTLLESLGKDPTMSGRTTGWPIILSFATNPVVGAGYESFWLGTRLEGIWAKFPGLPIGQAHNGYIEMYLILGWIGVAFLGTLIVIGYRNVISALRRDPSIGSLRLAYFVVGVVSGLTEGVFRMMSPTWIFFLLATAAAPWMAQVRASAVAVASPDLLDAEDADAIRAARLVS